MLSFIRIAKKRFIRTPLLYRSGDKEASPAEETKDEEKKVGRFFVVNRGQVGFFFCCRALCCGARIRCLFDPWIKDPDPGWEKTRDKIREPGWTSWILFFRTWYPFCGKNTEIHWSCLAHIGSGIRNGKIGSGIQITSWIRNTVSRKLFIRRHDQFSKICKAFYFI